MPDGVCVSDAVAEFDHVPLWLGVPDELGVCVLEGVEVGDGLCVSVRVPVAVCDWDGVRDGLGVAVALGVSVSV